MRARGLVVLLLALGGLGAGAEPQQNAVSIDNFAFSPAEITVAAGATVLWTNHDDIPHTVTASETPRAFKSPVLDTDQDYSVRFDHAGRFAYFCSLHPHMQGVVVVQ